ncbi:MAG: hypothetical protein WDA03_02265 [Trueperaceae bacterium]
MFAFLNNLAASIGVGDDPRVVYSLAAAALLALVSLFSGLGRLDFLALGRPAVLLRVGGGVAAAFLLVALTSTQLEPGSTPHALASGLARLPLYLLALGYGPSLGLLAGALFAAAPATGLYPGWPEALLILELTVLGWLAISPSPRRRRWAGPVNLLLAHLLTLGTAGVALSVLTTEPFTLQALLAGQLPALPGLALTMLALPLFGPAFYRDHLPGSRIGAVIAPEPRRVAPVAVRSDGRSVRTATPTIEFPVLEREGRERRRLVEPALSSDDPNG